MLFLLSPAKTLDFTPAPKRTPLSAPRFAADTAELSKTTRTLRPADLKRLMGISDELAALNHERFQSFDPASEDGVQAALAFAGDVYRGLDARSLDLRSLKWSQERLRLLSGLYGLLRPLDAIQPYRLEMGTKLKTARGPDLYAFWGARLAESLNEDARSHKDPTVVDLASQEYGGAVDDDALAVPRLRCAFQQEKDGELRTLALYAKHARGLLARYAILNRVERVSGLKRFDLEGYRWSKELSADGRFTFVRPQPEPVAVTRARAKAQAAAAAQAA